MKQYSKIQERVFDSEILQIRAIEEDDKKIIEGYAAVYNTRSKLLFNSFYETLEPTAFDNVLRSDDLDVVFNFNHNNSVIMGRTKNDTLTLNSDEKGLFFRAILPDTKDANDLHTLVKDGYISENSFAFLPSKDGYKQERQDDGTDLVTITNVERLRDVSIVTFPAYSGTEVSARNDEETTEEVVEEEVVVEEEREIEPEQNIEKPKMKFLKLN
jgi:HK97 family phage prohead protease